MYSQQWLWFEKSIVFSYDDLFSLTVSLCFLYVLSFRWKYIPCHRIGGTSIHKFFCHVTDITRDIAEDFMKYKLWNENT